MPRKLSKTLCLPGWETVERTPPAHMSGKSRFTTIQFSTLATCSAKDSLQAFINSAGTPSIPGDRLLWTEAFKIFIKFTTPRFSYHYIFVIDTLNNTPYIWSVSIEGRLNITNAFIVINTLFFLFTCSITTTSVLLSLFSLHVSYTLHGLYSKWSFYMTLRIKQAGPFFIFTTAWCSGECPFTCLGNI